MRERKKQASSLVQGSRALFVNAHLLYMCEVWQNSINKKSPGLDQYFFLRLPRPGGKPEIFLLFVYFLSQAAPYTTRLQRPPPQRVGPIIKKCYLTKNFPDLPCSCHERFECQIISQVFNTLFKTSRKSNLLLGFPLCTKLPIPQLCLIGFGR